MTKSRTDGLTGPNWSHECFSELFAWVRVYRARRSELQILKNNTFFKIDCFASDIVDLSSSMLATDRIILQLNSATATEYNLYCAARRR